MGFMFLRGRAAVVRFLVLLWTHSALGRPEDVEWSDNQISPVDLSFDKLEAALSIPKYSSRGYPGNDGGVPGPNFHQLSIQNKIRPAIPSVFPLEAFRSPANRGHGDIRRVQDTCDTQRTALDRCFSDEQCAQCYSDAIDAAANETTVCGAEESRLCAISNTTCFCTGCEEEAEIYYQCILENHDCTNVANCTDMTCDEDAIAVDACLTASTMASSYCLSCLVDTIDEVYASRETVSCLDYESAICPAIFYSCSCADCAQVVESWTSCLSPSCPSFDCNTTYCESQRTAFNDCLPDNSCVECYKGAINAVFEQRALCGEIKSGLCEISEISCASCGCEPEAEIYFQCILEDRTDCDSDVDCNCKKEINDVAACVDTQEIPCNSCLIEVNRELSNSTDLAFCQDYEDAVCLAIYDTCGCDYCSPKVEALYACLLYDCSLFECSMTLPPTLPPEAPTLPPMYSDPCYVCGDADFVVDPSKTVKIADEDHLCGDIQDEYASTQQASLFECKIVIVMVKEACNCQAPTDAPTDAPTKSPDRKDGFPSGIIFAALSAFVAILLIAAIVYFVMRKKTDHVVTDTKALRSSAPQVDEFNETPPTTPTGISPSYRHHADPASENHPHRAYGEVTVSSGRGRDLSVIATSKRLAPHATPSDKNAGGYLPRTKDQCLSLEDQDDIHVAVIIDAEGPAQLPPPDQRRHRTDP